MKNVSILLALTVALVAMSFAHAAVEIGSESGSGAINCPGTIDVTADGTYCNGELVPSASSSTTETSSAAQGGFVAATLVGALVAAFM
ncbi:hypothetical protein M9434_006578 [Picochlorum sp. BPE23]|nr:hypothetical protein M9434_006578 [Picochlorum sp. BPE23]